jgi:hypothetical protein
VSEVGEVMFGGIVVDSEVGEVVFGDIIVDALTLIDSDDNDDFCSAGDEALE